MHGISDDLFLIFIYCVQSIYMITSVLCRAVPYHAVRLLPDVWGRVVASQLTSHVTKGCGGAVISPGQKRSKQVHDRSNKEQPGPGIRQTAVAI